MISKIQIYSRGILTTVRKRISLALIIFSAVLPCSFSQDTLQTSLPDTLMQVNDSIRADTLATAGAKNKKNALDAEVKYAAEDSFRIVISEQNILEKVFMLQCMLLSILLQIKK